MLKRRRHPGQASVRYQDLSFQEKLILFGQAGWMPGSTDRLFAAVRWQSWDDVLRCYLQPGVRSMTLERQRNVGRPFAEFLLDHRGDGQAAIEAFESHEAAERQRRWGRLA